MAPFDTTSIRKTLAGESTEAPAGTPWECLVREDARSPGQALFLWESPLGEALAGIGTARRLEASGPERFVRIRQLLAGWEHRGSAPSGFPGAIAIGGFSFAEQGEERGWPGFADASFHIPSRVFWSGPGRGTVETRWAVDAPSTEATGAASKTPGRESHLSREQWIEAVRLTLGRIRKGEFSKAVLARSRDIELGPAAHPIAIMDSLRAAYPSCYRYLIADGSGNAFLGASPERLVRLAGGEITTEAVAGTLPCAPSEDEPERARTLAASAKEREEHRIVLAHLLQTLAPLADPLHAADAPEVMRLPHLLHLRTPVRGTVRPGAHVLDLVSRLHPTPAVAGWPRREALSWIDRIEGATRGWYAGPVGWLDARGNGDFAVGIRSIAIRGRSARIFAGAGIVDGSDPASEWSETEIKMRGILDAVARD